MINKSILPFLEKSASSTNKEVKKKAELLLDSVLSGQLANQISDQQTSSIDPNNPDANKKDIADALLNPAFPELKKTDVVESTFGKSASAYVSDILIKDLPNKTVEDIKRFIPAAKDKDKVVQYGMVVTELEAKVDDHNYKSALDHTNKDLKEKGKRVLGDKFQDKVKDKYILLLNDCIIDGHHFLALASILGITCSLKVLDLTPIRFQEKRSSLLSVYGQNYNCGESGTKVSLYSRITSTHRR